VSESISLLDGLRARGLIHQVTSEDLGDELGRGPITLYHGFDPSASSLHVGHLLPLVVMRHFQAAGHRVIALVGGATGLIGDPSGKSQERNLLSLETVAANGAKLEAQMRRILLAAPEPPLFRNNIDWLGRLGLLEFLRDTGKHFSVNAMIQKDSVRTRLERDEQGISFTEFSYSLLQARDFLELHLADGCVMQNGGSDQWGNIVAGVDLIRRATGKRAFGLTIPLLTDAEGRKFGKTEQGTSVWLDPSMTSPFRFYQFWLNTADDEVVKLLHFFTFLPLTKIAELAGEVGGGGRAAQRALGWEVTRMVHGEAAAERAVRASEVLFGGDIDGLGAGELDEIFADVPAITLDAAGFAGRGLVDLLTETGACASKGDARRQIAQGAIRVNGKPVATGDADPRVAPEDLIDGRMLVLKRGRRNSYLVRVTQ
jgi:tyrosyl-tRNA synthetase